jgi:hypothetical protein
MVKGHGNFFVPVAQLAGVWIVAANPSLGDLAKSATLSDGIIVAMGNTSYVLFECSAVQHFDGLPSSHS